MAGAAAPAAKMEPVAFLIIKGGQRQAAPGRSTSRHHVDRVIEVVPEVVEKVTDFLEKAEKKQTSPPEGETDHFGGVTALI